MHQHKPFFSQEGSEKIFYLGNPRGKNQPQALLTLNPTGSYHRHEGETTQAPQDSHSEQDMIRSKVTKHQKKKHQEKSNKEAKTGSQTVQMLKQ